MKLDSSKLIDRPLPWLRKKAQEYFNKYIRLRDRGKHCISCTSTNTEHASHFYSAGHYRALALNEDNVHASCVRCNTFLHGNLIEYRKRLVNRIGQDRVNELDVQAAIYKRNGFKPDKFYYIVAIETYKKKIIQLSEGNLSNK